MKVTADIEDLLVSGVKGNYERCDELFSSEGCMTYASVIDTEALKSEFMCMSMTVDTNEVSSLTSLVKELQKHDVETFWLLAKNFMTLVRIMLLIMPTSMSAERVFSALDRVRTKLRNNMGDKRLSDLVMLNFYPEMVDDMDVINICNIFVSRTSHTNKRDALFGKFVPSDLEYDSIKVPEISFDSLMRNQVVTHNEENLETEPAQLKKTAV